MGWQNLSQSSAPLAAVAELVLGTKADMLLTFIALASTANTVLLLLFAASRAMWGMSCAGVLPMKLCAIGKYRRIPWLTIIIVGIFTVIFALIRNIEDVAEFTNFATLLAFIGVNASALKIFTKDPARSKSKHVLGDIIVPLMGCFASFWLVIGLGWRAAIFGALLLVFGIIIYFLLKRFSQDARVV